MNFEFDPRKSQANRRKHGIDFGEAQRLWEDDNHIVVIASYPEERRFLTVGLIDGKHWTAIWTERGEAIRIISVRRARQEEARLYDSGRA
jgi:uncharacterized DUF497 family protein